MGYETWHWRVYNIYRRLFGLLAVLGGVGFFATGLLEGLGLMRPWFGDGAWVAALLGIPILLLGLALCRRRTYRPDLGDVSWLAGKAAGIAYDTPRSAAPRSWWTGDPKTGIGDRDA